MRRRTFLKSTAAVSGGVASGLLPAMLANAAPVKTGGSDRLGDILPTRPYGNTDERITILGTGGFHVGRGDEKNAQAIIETCLEGGVRFFDNAWNYHKGKSEEMYGKFLTPKYREDVFLQSKVNAKTSRAAEKQLEASLSRMKTDYLDLWLMHAVTTVDDAKTRFENGVIEVMLEAQASGKVRHIGFSGHTTTAAHLYVLKHLGEREGGDPFSSCQLPVNPVDYAVDHSFAKQVMPELIKRPQYAPLAMKTVLFGNAWDGPGGTKIVPERMSLEEMYWFALSMPVATWISGMETPEQAKQNIDIAKRFKNLTQADQLALVQRVVDISNTPGLEHYKRTA